ncbi:MAG: hypothetical protein HXS54_15870 [Theionarchaea archaeon]|nr:hypothetical protein [Theionarchaea archaeon]
MFLEVPIKTIVGLTASAVTIIVTIIYALYCAYRWLIKPRPEFDIGVTYKENEEEILFTICNKGYISVEDVQYVIEIKGDNLEVPNHTYSYDVTHNGNNTIVGSRDIIPKFSPAEERFFSIKVKKRRQGKTKVKIIIIHSEGQYKKSLKLCV